MSLWNAVCDKVLKSSDTSLIAGQFTEVVHLNPADPVIEGVVGTSTEAVAGAVVQLYAVSGS